jgi:hypothetical protein
MVSVKNGAAARSVLEYYPGDAFEVTSAAVNLRD